MHFRYVNWLMDQVMPRAKPGTFKVVALVARMTWGWNRPSMRLSLSEIQVMTGIGGRSSVVRAIQDALDRGWIGRLPSGNSFAYFIRGGPELLPSSFEVELLSGHIEEPLGDDTFFKEEETVERDPPLSPPTAKKRRPRPKRPKFVIPERLRTADFEAAWEAYVAHRRQVRSSLTQVAGQRALQRLAQVGPAEAIARINRSLENGWKGLFFHGDEVHYRHLRPEAARPDAGKAHDASMARLQSRKKELSGE